MYCLASFLSFILLAGCGKKSSASGDKIISAGSTYTISTLSLDSTNVGTRSGSVYTYTAATDNAHNVINVDMGADYLAVNICSTKSILNLSGTAVCNSVFGDIAVSNMYRNVATPQMTLTTEISTTSYACGYRNVPDVYKDDDGYYDSTNGCGNSGGNTDTCTSVVKATRPSETCGTTQATVSARIAHCLAQNPATATWNGATKGISGEGTWKLVTRTAGAKEVWRDERTGLVWSDTVAIDNWCKASGNGQTDGFCNGNTSSYCAEGGSLTPAIGGENWTTGVYNETKGGMGAVATDSSPSVRWRLATRNDWLQAEINGVRFVLPNMGLSVWFWTATIYSLNRNAAIYWGGDGGHSKNSTRESYYQYKIRCLGR